MLCYYFNVKTLSINIIYFYNYASIIIYTYIFTFRIHHVYNIHLYIAYSINIHSNIGVFLYILTFNVYIWPFSYKINEYYNGINIQNRVKGEGVYLYRPIIKRKSKRLRGGLKGVFLWRTFYRRFVFMWRTGLLNFCQVC